MHVLIIGGGLAGLTCARLLDGWRIPVTLLEASDGVGGRVRSDIVDGYILDRGFQVLFDAYPAVQRQLNAAALDLKAFDPGAIICANGRRTTLTDPLRDPDLDAKLEAGLTGAVSLADKRKTIRLALDLKFKSVDQILAGRDTSSYVFLKGRGFSDRIIDLFFRPFYGGVLFDRELLTSAKCLKFDFKMLADGNACLPSGGMGMIAQQLAGDLIERGVVRLNTRVAELLTEEEKIVGVRLENGEELRASAVVLATAAPEAARLSACAMPSGARGTVTLYYTGDAPFYRERKLLLNAAPGAFVNNAQLLTNVAPSYAPPGKHLLAATVIGIPELSDAELFREGLRDIHGCSKAT